MPVTRHGLVNAGQRDRWWDGVFDSRFGLVLAGAGIAGLALSATLRPAQAGAAAAQVWSPFVLVAGLLLIGLVADDDGLFSSAGQSLASTARSGLAIFIGSTLMVGVVTALLNLDTAVAFLTPVLVHAARRRGQGENLLLYGCILLANAGSLFLPGSNLTNLIVLGHLHLTGGQFLARMWAPALCALVTTALVVAAFEHKALFVRVDGHSPSRPPVIGLGLGAIALAAFFILIFPTPALPVVAIGIGAISVRLATGKDHVGRVLGVLGLPVLVGLFGVAVALGTLGRVWTGPGALLTHLNMWETAVVASIASVWVNNLPAASLLAAHHPPHPFALLVGLNIGPNLFVTGSLAWLLWLRAARSAGAQPSIQKASRMGLVAVPVSLVVTVGVLAMIG